MLSGSVGIHSKTVELYENERYSPIGGWSPKSLMLTDRSGISTQDGSSGWKDLTEASDALISAGWNWEPDSVWAIDMSGTNVDADGWTYNTDFGHFVDSSSGNGKKGMMHFVRRRKMLRSKSFDVGSICSLEEMCCDHCDLQEVDRLSTLFLEKLTQASCVKHPRQLSEPKMVQLKNGFIVALGFGSSERSASIARSSSISSERGSLSPSAAIPEATLVSEKEVSEGDDNAQTEVVPVPVLSRSSSSTSRGSLAVPFVEYNLAALTARLDAFVNQGKTTLSMASSVLASNQEDGFSKRIVEISRLHFSDEERSELARLVLRKFDLVFEYHCEKVNCGQQCQFAVETCPNLECGVRFSRKWAAQHDAQCPQKIIDCERVCGEMVMRRLMASHLCSDCVLRPVTCAFACLGCKSELVFKQLEGHMRDCQCDHLELSLGRILEHQGVITTMHNKIIELEGTVASQQTQITALQAGAAAAVIALAAHEKRQDKNLDAAIRSAEQKATRKCADVSSELHAEINKVRKGVQDLLHPK